MVKVWDGFIRGFHWLLVLGITVLYFSGEEGWLDVHFVTGYVLLALMLTRLVWGVIGSETARLSSLFHSPSAVVKSFSAKQAYAGHSPAGSMMVLFFFCLILSQLVSGLFTSDDILVEGPLVQYVSYNWVELASSLHRDIIDILLFAIAVHILAIFIYRIRGQKLVSALLSGLKREACTEPQIRSGKLAYVIFIVLACVILFVWGGEPLASLFSDF